MVEISYRFTFLDVLCEDEERAQDTRAGRARSEPPISHGHSWRSPEEAELFSYVRSLPLGISEQAPDATHRAWEPSEQPHPESITGEGSDLNVGSLGHPVLCKRPCMHVAAGRQCEATSATAYWAVDVGACVWACGVWVVRALSESTRVAAAGVSLSSSSPSWQSRSGWRLRALCVSDAGGGWFQDGISGQNFRAGVGEISDACQGHF